jgi:hypothetical protein
MLAILECLELWGEGTDMNRWYGRIMKKAQKREDYLKIHLGKGSTIRKCNACGQTYSSELLMADHCLREHTGFAQKE